LHPFPTRMNTGVGGEKLSMLMNACVLEEVSLPCRWCCSGTPISTDIKDFIGQFAFLGVEPFSDKAYFNRKDSIVRELEEQGHSVPDLEQPCPCSISETRVRVCRLHVQLLPLLLLAQP
jgi:hypothetical protein